MQILEFCRRISKCLYRLDKLIYDQGLDQPSDMAHCNRVDMKQCSDALIRLQKTLGGIAKKN